MEQTPMKHVFVLVALLACVAAVPAQAQAPAAPPFSAALEKAAVLKVITAAADWQLAHPSGHETWDWTQAAFYTGMMGLTSVTPDPKYVAAMRDMGYRNAWRPGPRPGHADDYAVSATYVALSQIDKDPHYLTATRALFDFLADRPYNESLLWGNRIETRELAWCDALFMGPPPLAALSAATGEKKYLDLANRLWWKTTEYLYDKSERLYFRDSRYFDQKAPNGRKVFWSRGNGWVFAGLARMLRDMPQDYPDRPKYVALFREMAEALAAVQSEDGYWRSSLLDAASRPNPETSGTGFFIYGFAWGINNGLLDRAKYEPAVVRGWGAMVKAMRADGMLGWVQPIGAEPGATTADSTEVFGVGALLLAGSEISRMIH
jgi:unsaturated rhamnogalacturonyl hydrolase